MMGKRWSAGLGVLGLCIGVCVLPTAPLPAACAHGGQFVPPPPTPGGAQPGFNPRANTPTEVTPGVGGPIVTPGSGVLQPKRVGQRKKPYTPTYEVTWQLWWDLNREAFLPRRPTTLRRAVVTPSGKAPDDQRARWEAERDRLTKEQLVPFLESVLDPATKQKDDVRASAAIALGKVALDASAIDVLWPWVVDDKAPDIVRESAALGLGLLRRTAANRQLGAGHLEPLRARLLQAFDRIVDGKRSEMSKQTRQFAMLAIGLLGDQPFGGGPQSKDGKLLSELLWQRFERGTYKTADYKIAVLSALSLQPANGVSQEAMDGLARLARGAKIGRKNYRPVTDAHGLSSFARLRGAGASGAFQALQAGKDSPRRPAPMRLAAVLALHEEAERVPASQRLLVARVLERAMGSEQEYLVMGLLNLALGRFVGADLADGSTRALESTKAASILYDRAAKGPWYMRGFGILALAIACRDVPADPKAARLAAQARSLFLQTLRDRKAEGDLRGAAAVALGLVGYEGAIGDLAGIVKNDLAKADLRAHAALALGQIGVRSKEVQDALTEAVTSEGPERLRGDAALGLSLLGSTESAKGLLEALGTGRRTSHLTGVTLALGQLGALEATGPLIEVASDENRPELVRAMAIVALGVLLDPEEWPSLIRLKRGAVYPLRTKALEEAFSII